VRKGGDWPPKWGQTAARPVSCRGPQTVAQVQNVHVLVWGHEVRAGALGRRRSLRHRRGPSGPRQTLRQAGVRPCPATDGGRSPGGRPIISTAGTAPGPAPAQVHRPALGEASPIGAECAQGRPPRLPWPGQLRGDDHHQAALPRRLGHQLVEAAERGVRPQGTRARVVLCLGERVLCLGPDGREAAVGGLGEAYFTGTTPRREHDSGTSRAIPRSPPPPSPGVAGPRLPPRPRRTG